MDWQLGGGSAEVRHPDGYARSMYVWLYHCTKYQNPFPLFACRIHFICDIVSTWEIWKYDLGRMLQHREADVRTPDI
jgi:hypothetical protein